METPESARSEMSLKEERDTIAASKRDPAAFGRIYDANFQKIFNYVLYRVGQVPLAEDIAAQTFFSALKNLGKFRWKGVSISAWLYRIASNEVSSHFRRAGKATFRDIDSLSDQLPDEGNTPDQELAAAEEIVARKEQFLLLNRCIRELKPIEQDLLILRYFNRKPYSEIAEILGRKEGTLRMRNKRALGKLKVLLENQGIENGTVGEPTTQDHQTGSNGRRISPAPAPESA